ncbi:MAG: TetR family transcriptional regulator, partial [Pararhizobium sp.]
MPASERRSARKRAVAELKRSLILQAARAAFETEGLEGTSLRSIAARAGYTPAALYFHFESKEALYGEVLAASLERLHAAVHAAAERCAVPADAFTAAGIAFYDFYRDNLRDLDLGFYLFRGGMTPKGLGRER